MTTVGDGFDAESGHRDEPEGFDVPSRLPPDESSDRRRNFAANGPLPRQIKDALEAGQLLKAFKLLRQAKAASDASAAPRRHPPSATGVQRGYRPGGLAPGEVPKRTGSGLLTIGIALLAMIAWWLLSSA